MDINFQLEAFNGSHPAKKAVKKLYKHSFPKSERKPFKMITGGIERGIMTGWILSNETGQPVALAFIIHGKEADVLDYLAIDPAFQGQGIGSKLLKFLEDELEHPFFVEIESTVSDPESDEKQRRKNFYLKNGLSLNPYEIDLFGVRMEMLSTRGKQSLNSYMETMDDYFNGKAAHWIRPVESA